MSTSSHTNSDSEGSESTPGDRIVSRHFYGPAGDADVIFQSCDGIQFHGEVVVLSETASTLELLFQYIYPQHHPELRGINFEDLAPLAEAAEKYLIYSAMIVCKIKMRVAIRGHALDVLNYAAKHAYPDVADDAARAVLKLPLSETLARLTPSLTGPWISYYSHWLNVLTTTAAPPSGTSFDSHRHRQKRDTSCDDWGRAVCYVIAKIGARVSSLTNLSTVFNDPPDSADCPFIVDDLKEWRRKSEEEIAKIPGFQTFCVKESSNSCAPLIHMPGVVIGT